MKKGCIALLAVFIGLGLVLLDRYQRGAHQPGMEVQMCSSGSARCAYCGRDAIQYDPERYSWVCEWHALEADL